jgi:hypothetical protein
VREINLSFDVRFAGARTATIASRRRSSALSGKMLFDTLGFVSFDRARVRLFFRYSDQRKNIKDCPALDFQFPGQIVDSNFTHPPCFFSKIR